MKKSICLSFVLKKSKFDSLCSLVMHQTESFAPSTPMSIRVHDKVVVSVCVKKSICVSVVLKKRKFDSLYSLVMHHKGLLLLESPISFTRRSSVLSVCVKKSICVFCVEEEKIRLTVFTRNASDRSFAPVSPI